MNIAQSQRLVVLDAWRGIAALFVALFRLDATGAIHGLPFVRNAWLFVDFFFVLSGFVIAFAYLDRLGDARTMRTFVIRRIGRIWPLHVVLLAVFVSVELARTIAGGSAAPTFIDNKAPVTIVWDLLLMQALGFTGATHWNTPAWSISTEFWTYIVFAILCFGGRRIVAVSAVLLIVAGLTTVGALSPKAMDTTFEYGFPRCLAGFFSGVLVCMVWQRWLRTLKPGAGLATVLEIIAVAGALVFVARADQGLLSLAAPAVFAGLIIVFAFEGGLLSSVLSGRAGRLIGDLSYSIYMTALLVSLPFNRLPVFIADRLGWTITSEHPAAAHAHRDFSLGHPLVNDLYTLAYLGAVIAVSWLTHRYIETPGRAFFNARAK